MLRPYQKKAIDDLYAWFSAGNQGNPCLNLPTGSGKSHIVAALCKDAINSWPETRLLMCSHVKELVEQNAEKMRQHWANAPLGIYSAGMNRREIDQITFASIQSIHGKEKSIGRRDLLIVDECHMISNKSEGRYRDLIARLTDINPDMRVIGLSATPHRLGQGLITQGSEAIFSDIIEPVTIAELVRDGYLAPLKSKHTEAVIDTSKVKKRGGEYVSSDLNDAADAITQEAIAEIVARADGRRYWLLFCSGVAHAEHCAQELRGHGVTAATVTGKTSKSERARIIADFKAGRITALTNADVLTTGFDAPNTDLIAFLRPTMSPALYVQMAGRGMRLKEHTDHCLVLDFAGNVEEHGPITAVNPPRMAGEGTGEAPVKVCPDCDELVHASVMECPECHYIFPRNEKPLKLSSADIMGMDPIQMDVTDWQWSPHHSRRSGKHMVKVRYYCGLAGPVIDEYYPVTHAGNVGLKSWVQLSRIAEKSGIRGEPRVNISDDEREMKALAEFMQQGTPPSSIAYFKRGKFHEVTDRIWL